MYQKYISSLPGDVLRLRHFLDQSIELIPQDLHSLLRLLPHLLRIFQLTLKQLLQFLVLLLHLLVPDGFFHKRVYAAGLDGGLLRVPIIVTKRILKHGYLFDHLIMGRYDLFDISIA